MPENPPIHAILNAVTDEKPKIFQSGRDIIYSLAAILAVMIASVAFTGMCSYGRNTPQNTPVVKVDAATFFNLEARASNFPIRLPQVPDDWTPNSANPRPSSDGSLVTTAMRSSPKPTFRSNKRSKIWTSMCGNRPQPMI